MSVPPLVPPEVDLRDFAYMPLDVLRLRDSDLSAEATAEEFRAAVMLWCAAWHQIPAASLADSDAALAKLAGFGRDIAGWQEVKEGALRGWVKCDDGRLYHPVVAEKANEAWEQKTKQRNRTAAARAVRMGRRNDGCYRAPDNSDTDNVTTPVTDNVTPSKGTERNGIEEKIPEANASGHFPDGDQKPVYSDARHELWGEGKRMLADLGISVSKAAPLIGQWVRESGDDCPGVLDAIRRAREHKPVDPIAWIVRALPQNRTKNERQSNGNRIRDAFDKLGERLRPCDGEEVRHANDGMLSIRGPH